MEQQHPGYDILVVDDDCVIRDMIGELLQRRYDNVTVATAADGADAIDKMRGGFRPTLVLSDLNMPVIDGLGLVEWMRHVHPGTAVVGMSCAPDHQDQFDDFIAKPFVLADLFACVSRWVRVRDRNSSTIGI